MFGSGADWGNISGPEIFKTGQDELDTKMGFFFKNRHGPPLV